MKKWSLILAVASALCLVVSVQAIAAPTATVSAKYQYLTIGHCALIELGVPVTSHWTLVLQGGSAIPPAAAIMGGVRYYFATDTLRPFATLYAGYILPPGPPLAHAAGTVGLEYLSDWGLRVAGEVGGWIGPGMPLFFTGAFAVGIGF